MEQVFKFDGEHEIQQADRDKEDEQQAPGVRLVVEIPACVFHREPVFAGQRVDLALQAGDIPAGRFEQVHGFVLPGFARGDELELAGVLHVEKQLQRVSLPAQALHGLLEAFVKRGAVFFKTQGFNIAKALDFGDRRLAEEPVEGFLHGGLGHAVFRQELGFGNQVDRGFFLQPGVFLPLGRR